jgi:hypothetical protein
MYHAWDKRATYVSLVGKSEEKRSVGRPRRRWENNIKLYCREMRYGGMGWIHLVHDRDKCKARVKTVIKPWVS